MRNFIITGTPRSGTSLVAEFFHLQDYYLGEQLLPASEMNSRGFFESAGVNEVNDRILEKLGAKPNPAMMDPVWWLLDVAPSAKFTLRSEGGLQKRVVAFGRNTPFAYKDPRFCHTWPLWKDWIGDHELIVTFRHPLAFMRSLFRGILNREWWMLPFDPEYFLSVWVRMNSSVIRYSHEWPVHFFEFDSLFDDAGKSRLASLLDLSGESVVIHEGMSHFQNNIELPDLPASKILDEALVLYAWLKRQRGLCVH